MRRYRFVLLAIILSLLLSTCAQFDPQWMGTWVDDTTVRYVTITLDLGEDEGTLTVDNENLDAKTMKSIIKGTLEGDEDTLTATISSIYAETKLNQDGITLTGALLEAYVTTEPDDGGLGLPGLTNSVSYHIEGNTMTLKGELISVLTEGQSDTLTAVKQ
jgi:hypothetical protein